MKTAMQELIELLERHEETPPFVFNYIEQFKSKEKQQLVEAYKAHCNIPKSLGGGMHLQERAEQYYSETFKQN